MKFVSRFLAWLLTFNILLSGTPFMAISVSAQIADITPTPEVTPAPTPETTPEPTAEPTVVVTPEPTPEVTIAPDPTPEVTPAPTPETTPEPTAEPTAVVTLEPTPEATIAPDPTQSPAPEQPAPPQDQPAATAPESTPAPTVETTVTPTPVAEVPVENDLSPPPEISATVLENALAPSVMSLVDQIIPTGESSATLVTDKPDYAPTDSVLITGTNFEPDTAYTIYITSDTGSYVHTDTITSDENGSIIYTLQLDGTYRPDYKVEVKLAEAVVASTTFTDSPPPSSTGLTALATGGSCILDVTDDYADLNCTSNDVELAGPWVDESTLDGCTSPNDTATFDLYVDVNNNATERYDVGVWISTDGDPNHDGSYSGLCDVFKLPLPSAGPPAIPGFDLDQDACGDVAATSATPDIDRVFIGNVTLPCSDVDHDGQLDVPIVTSWSNSDKSVCSIAQDTIPETKAKCKTKLDFNIPVPVPGQIIIKKDTVPDASSQVFNFTLTGGTFSTSFNLSDGGTWDSGVQFTDGLSEGIYSVSEAALSDWDQTSAICVSSLAGNTETISNLNLQPGETITCTFTNTLRAGSIIVHKDVQGPNGEAVSDPTQFKVKLDGASEQPIAEGSPVTYSNVSAGPHTITESVIPAGYSFYSFSPDGDTNTPGAQITVNPGQTTEITIVNKQQATFLTLTKNVVNDNGGTATAANFQARIDGGNVSWGTPIAVSPGQHTASEIANVAGYSPSAWGTDCAANGIVTLAMGESKTCSITNDDIAPKLTLVKTVTNDNGGNLVVSDFPLFINGIPATSGVAYDQPANVLLTATETTKPGYTASVWGGNCATNGTITLLPGDDKTCTITNNDQTAHLKLIKEVTNDNGGTLAAFAWTLTAAGDTTYSGSGGFDLDVDAGTYTLSESNISGYSTNGFDCGPSVTLAVGESKTCTIINDDNAPSLTLTKIVSNDNGGTSATSAWTLTATGPTGFSGAGPSVSSPSTFDAGTYTLSESGPTGYSAGSWTCAGGTQNGDSITLNLGQSATCTITNNDIAPSLTLVKNVVNNNGGSAAAVDWTLTASGPTPISGAGGAASGSGFSAGTYALSESTGPSGYLAGSWSCIKNNGSPVPGSSITLALSDTAICSITNDDIQPQLTVIKHVINDEDGSLSADDFTMEVDGLNVSDTSFPGSETGTTVTLDSGTYSVNETGGDESYTPSLSPDCSGTINIGEHKTCTITNDDSNFLPTVNLTKTAVPSTLPEPGGIFTFTLTIHNTSIEDVTITALTDDNVLSTECLGLVGDTLAAGASTSCTYTISHTEYGSYPNTASVTVRDNEGSTATDSDDETVTVTDVLPTVNLTKTAVPSTLPEPGGIFTFTLTIHNTSIEDVTITALTDDNVLSTECLGLVGDTLAAGASTSCTYTVSHTEAGSYDNTANVTVADNEGNTAPDSDDETVRVTDVLPDISVTKSADPTSVPETGGDITYTYVVTNNSVEPVTIDSLSDDVFGTLAGDADCQVGTALPVGGSCEFTSTHFVTGNFSGTSHVNIFTAVASDNDGHSDTATDDAVVTFIDVLPDITVVKTANPTSVPETGSVVPIQFTVSVTSHNSESINITSLHDNIYGNLDGLGDCYVGGLLTSGATYTCTFTGNVGPAAGTYTDIVTAVGSDNDGNTDTDSDDATVAVVGAKISLTPGSATNPVNQPHTFTATVMENPGTGWVPAAGEIVTFTLENNTAGAAFFSGNTCTTDSNGQCDIQINSATPGSVQLHGAVDAIVLTHTLHRETDGTLGSGSNASKTYEAGRIIIEKQTLPNTSAQSFEFDPSWSTSNFSLTNGQQNDSGWLPPGAYSVSETAVPGWDLTGMVCTDPTRNSGIGAAAANLASIDLAAGETVTCTFTNTQRGHIIIDKTTSPVGSTQSFDFTVTGTGYSNFSLTNAAAPNDQEVIPGTYSVTETAVTGWDLTGAVCTDGSLVSAIEVSPGETVTCTITNIQRGKIITEKQTLPNTSAQSFEFDPSWSTTNFFLTTGQQEDSGWLVPGSYSLAEVNLPADWDLTGASCLVNGDRTTAFDPRADGFILLPGDIITCTFTNTQRARIIVEKEINTEIRPEILPTFNFTLTGTTPGSASIAAGNFHIFENLIPGNYSVEELAALGWQLTDSVCVPFVQQEETFRTLTGITGLVLGATNPIAITLEPGQTYRCTFTNTFVIPELQISKTNNASGDKSGGDNVLYTITVQALNNAALGVYVTDLLPEDFSYRSGSWTSVSSVRGDLKAGGITTQPSYSPLGVWNLGDMIAGEIVTLTYLADIAGDAQPGEYKDLAWAKGQSVVGDNVLAEAVDPGKLSTNYVGTLVRIGGGSSITGSYKVTGEVLGASIELPATGTPNYLTLLAFALVMFGLTNLGLGVYYRRKHE